MDPPTSRNYEVRVAKRIYMHLNGKSNERPKMIVVNDRHVRDFTTLLNRVTSGIRAPIAVRNIYTPVGGSKVSTLHGLENGKYYVAGGAEQFKKLRYSNHFQPRPNVTSKPSQFSNAKPTFNAVSRFKNLPEKPYLIHVFRNGDIIFQGARVLLSKRVMTSLENVLELITEKVDLSLPAKKLCTLEGQVIHTVTDIKDGENYVAIEGVRKFVRLPYKTINSTLKSTRYPRSMKRLSYQSSIPLDNNNSTLGGTYTIPSSIPEKPKQIKRLMPPKQHKGKNRPFAGRKDIEARNLALSDARADSAFGNSHVIEKHSTTKASTPAQSEHDNTFDESILTDDNQTESILKENSNSGVSQTNDKLITKHSSENKRPSVQEKVIETVDTIEQEPTEIEEEVTDEVPETVEETIVEQTNQDTNEIIEEIIPVQEAPVSLQTHDTNTIVELQSEANQQSVDLSVARVQETNSTTNAELEIQASTADQTVTTSSSTNQLQTESSQV